MFYLSRSPVTISTSFIFLQYLVAKIPELLTRSGATGLMLLTNIAKAEHCLKASSRRLPKAKEPKLMKRTKGLADSLHVDQQIFA